MLRRLGFGTYRLATEPHAAALRFALKAGVRRIDTSPNYGESERIVGEALRWFLREENGAAREEVTVITKVGLLQGPTLDDARERESAGRPWPGLIKLSRSAWFCISPEYIEHSLRASTERLGTRPDVVLLHNPEFILASQLARSGRDAVGVGAFYDQLEQSFGALSAHHDGEYGLSSNISGLRYSVSGGTNDVEAVDLGRARAAASVHGDARRCSVVQLPLNLLEPDAAIAPTSAVEALRSNSTLSSNGAEAMGGAESDNTDMAASASPMADARTQGWAVLTHRPIHAIPPASGLAGGFGVQRGSRHLSLRDAIPNPPAVALVRQAAAAALAPHMPDAHSLRLEEIALLFALHAPHTDAVLCGMRQPSYVEETVRLLTERPPLSPEAHAAVAHAMRALVDELQAEEERRPSLRARSPRVPPPSSNKAHGAPSSVFSPRANVAAASAGRRSLCSSGGGQARPGGPPLYIDLPAATAADAAALLPATDGGPLAAIGTGDRGSGLVYRAGRLAIDAATASARSNARSPREGKWLVKVQAPLDSSGDAQGGMGRMTPSTLLLHDEEAAFCALLREEEKGHSTLLRCALKGKGQIAYLWAEDVRDASGQATHVRLFTELVQPDDRW